MSVNWQSFLRDERGSVYLEFTVTVTVFLLVLFGIVEFSYLFYQWNTATKATQFGARLAAVSNPVAGRLTTLTGLSNSVLTASGPSSGRVTMARPEADDGGSGACLEPSSSTPR